MVCDVIASNFRFFWLSVVPYSRCAAMETAEAEGVAVNVSSNFSFSSCELIMEAVEHGPFCKSGVGCIGGSYWMLKLTFSMTNSADPDQLASSEAN